MLGRFVATGYRPQFLERLHARGIQLPDGDVSKRARMKPLRRFSHDHTFVHHPYLHARHSAAAAEYLLVGARSGASARKSSNGCAACASTPAAAPALFCASSN